MRYLKLSTQVVEQIGPFLDKTDGVTEEAGLAGAGTEISKAGAAFGAGPVLGTYDSDGYYPVTLTTTHTNTLGSFMLKVNDAATHLPVWHEFCVVSAAFWDWIHGSTIPPVNATQISGDSAAADNAEAFFDGTGYAGTGNVIPTVTNLTNAPSNGDLTAAMKTSVTTAATAATPVAASVTGNVGGNVAGSVASVTAGVTLAASAVQAIWDAATSALTTAGSIGKKLADWAIHSAADVWAVATRTLTAGTNIALAKGTGVTGFTDIDAAGVRTAVGLASANLDTQIAALPTAASTTTAVWAAAARTLTANTNFNDPTAATIAAAVVGETMTELAAIPSASPTLKQAVALLYMALRNKVTVSATAKIIHNDAGTALGTKALSDDGTTYTEAEIA